jgi:pimeloyl-ACP methyl ester carboxylesterase
MPTVRVRGANLFYADDDFVEPWLPHETILLQHFAFGNHTEFQRWVPVLAREYRVLRLDRRGCGLSAKPPLGYRCTPEELTADCVGFLDALGLERVHHVGYGLGGSLGAVLAATHPERVQSLVLCSSPPRGNPKTLASWARPGFRDGPSAVMALGSWIYALTAPAYAAGPQGRARHSPESIYRAQQMALTPAHVLAAYMRMVARPEFDLAPLLPRIQAPALVLSAPDNPHAPLAQQSAMGARIPDCRQVVIEGDSYLIAYDQPERCAAEVLRFVREHSLNRVS